MGKIVRSFQEGYDIPDSAKRSGGFATKPFKLTKTTSIGDVDFNKNITGKIPNSFGSIYGQQGETDVKPFSDWMQSAYGNMYTEGSIQGNKVKVLQRKLYDDGYYKPEERDGEPYFDGYYGDSTASAWTNYYNSKPNSLSVKGNKITR